MGIQIYLNIFSTKTLEKLSEWPILAVPIYTNLFGKNCRKNFRMPIFGHSKFIPVFMGKNVGKIQNAHFWPF